MAFPLDWAVGSLRLRRLVTGSPTLRSVFEPTSDHVAQLLVLFSPRRECDCCSHGPSYLLDLLLDPEEGRDTFILLLPYYTESHPRTLACRERSCRIQQNIVAPIYRVSVSSVVSFGIRKEDDHIPDGEQVPLLYTLCCSPRSAPRSVCVHGRNSVPPCITRGPPH
jgi:hypothetical protein